MQPRSREQSRENWSFASCSHHIAEVHLRISRNPRDLLKHPGSGHANEQSPRASVISYCLLICKWNMCGIHTMWLSQTYDIPPKQPSNNMWYHHVYDMLSILCSKHQVEAYQQWCPGNAWLLIHKRSGFSQAGLAQDLPLLGPYVDFSENMVCTQVQLIDYYCVSNFTRAPSKMECWKRLLCNVAIPRISSSWPPWDDIHEARWSWI